MSLLSTDIKKKRLSVKTVSIQPKAPEPRLPVHTPVAHTSTATAPAPATVQTATARPLSSSLLTLFSPEVIAYRSLVARSPLVGELVQKLELTVRVNKLPDSNKVRAEVRAVAYKVMRTERSYNKTQIEDILSREAGLGPDEAEECFKILLDEGALERAINPELYYLVDSTPF